MKKFIAIAFALAMVFTLGIASGHAQQADTATHGRMMMMNCKCAGMSKTNGMKCPMGTGKCSVCSHQGSMMMGGSSSGNTH